MRLSFTAGKVYLVLGGEGTVHAVTRDAKGAVIDERDVAVSGAPTLYPMLDLPAATTGTLEVEVPTSLSAYSFTFG